VRAWIVVDILMTEDVGCCGRFYRFGFVVLRPWCTGGLEVRLSLVLELVGG
jgi:hypothetical protein